MSLDEVVALEKDGEDEPLPSPAVSLLYFPSFSPPPCTCTSIHESLVQGEALGNARMVKARCVHRDVHEYLLMPVIIKVWEQKHNMEVAVNSLLTHPLVCGENWIAFRALVTEIFVDGSCSTGTLSPLAGMRMLRLSKSAPCQGDTGVSRVPPLHPRQGFSVVGGGMGVRGRLA